MEKCPCGSLMQYTACCKLIHDDLGKAHTAESLMRARYTAFTKGLIDFLYNTTHPTSRRFIKKVDVQSWTDQRKWMRLEILNTTKTTVEFKAHYLESLEPRIQHEKSTFKASHGKWYYLDGIFLS